MKNRYVFCRDDSRRPAKGTGSVLARAVLLCLSCMMTSCSDRTTSVHPVSETDPIAPTGVILISIDTLRADRLGAYNPDSKLTPFLDELARRSVVFENTYVQLPGTLPSHMSIFTGLYPEEHGVYPPAGRLADDTQTIAEVFEAANYRAAAFTDGGYVDGAFGFSRGFETYFDKPEPGPRQIEQTLSSGLEFLSALQPEERFFLFMHSYSVHDPYEPPDLWASSFGVLKRPDTAIRPTGPNLVQVNQGGPKPSDEALSYYKTSYDAGVSYMDSQLKVFFDGLEKLGLDKNTLIVITSDHGEEFMEHGRMTHEQIYQETLRVPLIFVHPELPPSRHLEIAESIDIAPTILGLVSLEFDAPISGKRLSLLRAESPPSKQSSAIAESFIETARTLVYRDGTNTYQMIVRPAPSDPSDEWVEGAFICYVDSQEISFEAMAFHRPRRITVSSGLGAEMEVSIAPDDWSQVRLEAKSDSGPVRVVIESDGCDSPASLGINADRRCLSFRLRGLEGLVDSYEVYDNDSDPLQMTNLASDQPSLLGHLKSVMKDVDLKNQAARQTAPLTAELEERLRSLGYLR